MYQEALMLFLRKSFKSLLTPTVAPNIPRETFTGSASVPFWVLILPSKGQKAPKEGATVERVPVCDRIHINSISDKNFLIRHLGSIVFLQYSAKQSSFSTSQRICCRIDTAFPTGEMVVGIFSSTANAPAAAITSRASGGSTPQ